MSKRWLIYDNVSVREYEDREARHLIEEATRGYVPSNCKIMTEHWGDLTLQTSPPSYRFVLIYEDNQNG